MPRQAKAVAALALESGWLDGEVVVADDNGIPNFQLIQNAFQNGDGSNIIYYLFDLPYLNGMDLRETQSSSGARKTNGGDVTVFRGLR